MRVLFVGDVVGRPGREAVTALVPGLRQSLRLDAVVVNCENAADGGKGVTGEQADAFLAAGVDVLTGGNHIWHCCGISDYVANQPRLVRPANHPGKPGSGTYIHSLADGRTLGVGQVEGRVFMKSTDCPFQAADKIVAAFSECTASLVDFHAEATSEKQAMGWHLDGRVSALLGTHTHVASADERLLRKGTAYISDVGMTGAMDSVIGLEIDAALQRFVRGQRPTHRVAEDNVQLHAVVLETDDSTGRAVGIVRHRVAFEGMDGWK